MTIAYSVIFVLSLLLPFGYYLFVRKNQNEPWLFVLYVSVSVVNLGYLLLSLAETVEFALNANKITYLGQVFMPLCMFMLVSKLSGITYRKWIKLALVGAAMAMFALVLTTGHLDWYYKSVELTHADGAAKLIKEYGFLHPANLIYVLGYFVAMLVVIFSSLKKNNGFSQKLVGLMLAVVIGNIGMWIVEKLVTWNFEFLSVSYLMSEFVFFFVYWLLLDYTRLDRAPQPPQETLRQATVDLASISVEEKILKILSCLKPGEMLATRERQILELILQNKKRKEIAEELCLSENTIKTYTRTLYGKVGVSSREELYALLIK